MGTTVATTIVSSAVAVLEGLTALAALVALQFGVAFVSTRFRAARKAIMGEPALLLSDGRLLRDAMHRERITDQEVLQALRQHSLASVDEAEAVVLETNGSLAVIKRSAGRGDALAAVRGNRDGRR